MNKNDRFTLKEVFEALIMENPATKVTYKTLYARLRKLIKTGAIPDTVKPDSLSYEQVLAVLRNPKRMNRRRPVRKEAVHVLRVNLKNDGVF